LDANELSGHIELLVKLQFILYICFIYIWGCKGETGLLLMINIEFLSSINFRLDLILQMMMFTSLV